jgi:hypothetical protein
MTRIALFIYIFVFMLCMVSVHAQDYYTTNPLPQMAVTDRSMNTNMVPLQNGTVVTPQLVVPNTGTVSIPSSTDASALKATTVPNANINIMVIPSMGNSRPVTGAVVTPLVMPQLQPNIPVINWQFHPDGSATKITSWPHGGTSSEYYDPTRAPRGVVHNTN